MVQMPCKCRGTVGLIHPHCLRKLVDHTSVCATCRGHLVPPWRRCLSPQRCAHCSACGLHFFCDRRLFAYFSAFSLAVFCAIIFMVLYLRPPTTPGSG